MSQELTTWGLEFRGCWEKESQPVRLTLAAFLGNGMIVEHEKEYLVIQGDNVCAENLKDKSKDRRQRSWSSYPVPGLLLIVEVHQEMPLVRHYCVPDGVQAARM